MRVLAKIDNMCKDFVLVFMQEFKALFSSVSALLIIFGGSLFYLFLYPTPYYNDVISKQRVAIIDYDSTSTSRELIHYFRASPYLEIAEILHSPNKAQALIESNEIYGIITIPKDFEKHLYSQIPPTIAISANASYLLIYGAIANAASEAISGFNAHLKTKLQHKDYDILAPSLLPLFNPSLGYINYTLAPVLIFILHQTLIAGAGIIGGTQNQQFNQGVRNYYSNANPALIVLSKIILLFGIYVLLFAFYFGFAYQAYGVSVNASVLDFWLFSSAFIFATAAFGVFFGAILPKRALSTQIIMLASMPLVFLLGFIWQKSQIAPLALDIMHLLPAYHGINGLLELNQMAAPFHLIRDYFISLLVLGVAYSALSAFIIYKRTRI